LTIIMDHLSDYRLEWALLPCWRMGWQMDLRVVVVVVVGTAAVAEGILAAGEGTVVAVAEDIVAVVVHIDYLEAATAVGNSDCIAVAVVVPVELVHFLVEWHPPPLGLVAASRRKQFRHCSRHLARIAKQPVVVRHHSRP
jgi:hypothetical protein